MESIPENVEVEVYRDSWKSIANVMVLLDGYCCSKGAFLHGSRTGEILCFDMSNVMIIRTCLTDSIISPDHFVIYSLLFGDGLLDIASCIWDDDRYEYDVL